MPVPNRLPALLLALLAAAAPAPRGPSRVDPGTDPADPGADPGEALQRQLSSRLPGGWKVSLPQNYLGVAAVAVQIPDAWRGSPAAAAVALCPDPDSAVWQRLPLLRLVVHYHGRDWPPYDCRP